LHKTRIIFAVVICIKPGLFLL